MESRPPQWPHSQKPLQPGIRVRRNMSIATDRAECTYLMREGHSSSTRPCWQRAPARPIGPSRRRDCSQRRLPIPPGLAAPPRCASISRQCRPRTSRWCYKLATASPRAPPSNATDDERWNTDRSLAKRIPAHAEPGARVAGGLSAGAERRNRDGALVSARSHAGGGAGGPGAPD